MRLPELLARASGTRCEGPHQCVYCGSPAAAPHAVPDTFTARHTLAAPHGKHVCAGCEIAREEVGVANYPDGTSKEWSKAFRRSHTWLVTNSTATPFFVAHLPILRRLLLSPPPPPWGACLVSPTNGVPYLYRTPVNVDVGHFAVLVHGERVDFTAAGLRDRLTLTCRIAALAGRPALDESPRVPLFAACLDADVEFGEAVAAVWPRLRTEPLTRLALFFTPKRDDCDAVLRDDLGAAPAGGR